MNVRVKLFARAKDLAGTSEVVLQLSGDATVAELRRVLADHYPALGSLLLRSAIAVADDFAADSVPLSDGAEAALLPPVSGGSP
jgi:molybdopterin converting factor subunit 1